MTRTDPSISEDDEAVLYELDEWAVGCHVLNDDVVVVTDWCSDRDWVERSSLQQELLDHPTLDHVLLRRRVEVVES